MPKSLEVKQSKKNQSCSNCGAEMQFNPGTEMLKCAYCDYQKFIVSDKNSFEELEIEHYLNLVGNKTHTRSITLLNCKNCGANQHVKQWFKSLACVYCGESLVLEDSKEEQWILPGALIPFQIDRADANKRFKQWVSRVWFAPNELKKATLKPEKLQGLYVPYWTFDANLIAEYIGKRGDYYYASQRVISDDGKSRVQKVQKTSWKLVSGTVQGFLGDLLVDASKLQKTKIPNKISSWSLKELTPFDEQYLLGFLTEKYTVSLKQGHQQSYRKAKKIAQNLIRRDIGGDTQRIDSFNIQLENQTFKHILLPLYLSVYQFRGKPYQFYINGQTGEVAGKHPISFWKVFFIIVVIVLIIVLVLYLGS